MELEPAQRRETNASADDPGSPRDAVDRNASERAERALAWERLDEYLSGDHEWSLEEPAVASAGNNPSPAQTRAPSAPRAPEQVLPVSRFSPSPGLIVDRTGASVAISGFMELHGPEANASRAALIQQAINTNWTRRFEDGHSRSGTVRPDRAPPMSRKSRPRTCLGPRMSRARSTAAR
jgi:hypothetical protein